MQRMWHGPAGPTVLDKEAVSAEEVAAKEGGVAVLMASVAEATQDVAMVAAGAAMEAG